MAEILVNDTGSAGPVAVLGTSRQFVVAWTTDGVITCARLPMSGGGTVSDLFTVNDLSASATWPVLAMVLGGFVVAWTSGHNVFLQRMSVDGHKVGGRIQVNEADADPARPPAVARLLDGGLVVCWADATLETVRAQIFRGDLSRFGDRFVVNVPRDGEFEMTGLGVPHGVASYQPAVTWLAVSDADPAFAFVVAWQRGRAVETTSAHYRYFLPGGKPEVPPPGTPPNTDGTPMGIEHQAKFDLLCRPGALCAVPGGGFFGLRLPSSPGNPVTDNAVVADSYDSTGALRISGPVTGVDDHMLRTLPAITLTPTNDFVIVWAEAAGHAAGDPGRSIRGVSTDLDLLATGAVTISTSPPGEHDAPCVACTITDFGYATAVVWLDGRSVKARVFRNNDLQNDV
jgi:hypothetical protein